MYVEYDFKTKLWCVYNIRDKLVATFPDSESAYRYLEQ